MFINFLKLIGLQKSIGEIYGLLFVSSKPLLWTISEAAWTSVWARRARG